MVHQTVSESTQNADDMTDTHDIKSSQEPLHLESSRQNKCDIKSFLKRNAFVLLTIGAIATGKSKRSVCVQTHIYIYLCIWCLQSCILYVRETLVKSVFLYNKCKCFCCSSSSSRSSTVWRKKQDFILLNTWKSFLYWCSFHLNHFNPLKQLF